MNAIILSVSGTARTVVKIKAITNVIIPDNNTIHNVSLRMVPVISAVIIAGTNHINAINAPVIKLSLSTLTFFSS